MVLSDRLPSLLVFPGRFVPNYLHCTPSPRLLITAFWLAQQRHLSDVEKSSHLLCIALDVANDVRLKARSSSTGVRSVHFNASRSAQDDK